MDVDSENLGISVSFPLMVIEGNKSSWYTNSVGINKMLNIYVVIGFDIWLNEE